MDKKKNTPYIGGNVSPEVAAEYQKVRKERNYQSNTLLEALLAWFCQQSEREQAIIYYKMSVSGEIWQVVENLVTEKIKAQERKCHQGWDEAAKDVFANLLDDIKEIRSRLETVEKLKSA